MRSKNILALDFDGLLVDGLKECVLVTWNGYCGESVDSFSDEGLARVPAAFIGKFKQHRSFAKHLGHFLMPFQEDIGTLETQSAFDAAYAALDWGQVERFIMQVTDYRAQARKFFRARWLAYHEFYPGLEQMLRSASMPVCIVTAKDHDSVQEILRHAGIRIPDERIYGECREKLTALQAIAESFGVQPQDICFFDDNVLNARDALQAGFRSHWANWGYHAPEHFAIAQSAGLPVVQLEDLVLFETGAAT